MDSIKVDYKRLSPLAKIPKYSTAGAAAFDLYAAIEESITIQPGERVEIPFGFAIEIPRGYKMDIRSRSGLFRDHYIEVYPGLIDSDYRGPISAWVTNGGDEAFTVECGDRVAQGEISTYQRVHFAVGDTLSETQRGEKGYGSTGIK